MEAGGWTDDGDRWDVSLDPWVTEQTLLLLRRAAETVASPGAGSDGRAAPVMLSTPGGRLAVSGTLMLPGGEWTVRIGQSAELGSPIDATRDHAAVAARLVSWTARLLAGDRQPASEVEKAEDALRDLVEGAAHASMAGWECLIVDPRRGAEPPTIVDAGGAPGHPNAWIDCRPNTALLRALVGARDPFVHVSQRITSRRIEVAIGAAPFTILENQGDPLRALRLASRLPSGSTLRRLYRPG